jgi:hypothetical protein
MPRLARLGALAAATGTTHHAWALPPTHAHLLLRSGPGGLPSVRRRRLTGYAPAYNRRHRRQGPLFQNRFQSSVVEAHLREAPQALLGRGGAAPWRLDRGDRESGRPGGSAISPLHPSRITTT